MLESEVAFLKRLGEVEMLIQLVPIHGDLNASHFPAAPHVVSNFDFVSEPSIRLDESLVDMTKAVQRSGANGVGVCTIDLHVGLPCTCLDKPKSPWISASVELFCLWGFGQWNRCSKCR